jgi:hypothetical protein
MVDDGSKKMNCRFGPWPDGSTDYSCLILV